MKFNEENIYLHYHTSALILIFNIRKITYQTDSSSLCGIMYTIAVTEHRQDSALKYDERTKSKI
jgi:hypothetical protein